MMRFKLQVAVSLCVGSLALAAKDPDYAAVSEKLVGDVLAVKAGEVVSVEFTPGDEKFVEAVVVALGKRNVSARLSPWWPEMSHQWLLKVPAEFDSTRRLVDEKLLAITDAEIAIERVSEPYLDVPPARLSAFSKTFDGFTEKRAQRKLRSVGVGNGLSPSKANAKRLGISEADLSKMFWDGLATDYSALVTRGAAVKAAFPAGKRVEVSTPTGTKLTFKIGVKALQVSDGVISADDVKTGGAALTTWLPAGEVFGLIETGSAEGTVVVPHLAFQGEDIRDLTATIVAGKITSLTAKPSKAFTTLKALYDAAQGSKDALSVFDVGINTDVKPPKGKQVESFVTAGVLILTVGSDSWAGGSNSDSFGLNFFQFDATIRVEGTPVVEAGKLVIGR